MYNILWLHGCDAVVLTKSARQTDRHINTWQSTQNHFCLSSYFNGCLRGREREREREKETETQRENTVEAVGVEPWCCIVSFGGGLYLMAGLGLNELN